MCLQYEFDSLHLGVGKLVDQRHISWSQIAKLTPPARVGNLDAQNSVNKIERAGPVCDGATTRKVPGQQSALAGGRAPNGVRDKSIKAGSCVIQIGLQLNGYIETEEAIVAPEKCGALLRRAADPTVSTLSDLRCNRSLGTLLGQLPEMPCRVQAAAAALGAAAARRIIFAIVQVVVVGQLFSWSNVAQGDHPHLPSDLIGLAVRLARVVDERGHTVAINDLLASVETE